MAKVALLIGVSEYEPGLNPLPAAVKDVEAMLQMLSHPEMGGFAQTDIIVLKNPQRQEMEEAIYNLFTDRQKDDLLLLFFSGHGIKDDTGKLYLATRTTRKTPKGGLIRPSAVAASFVHESMSYSRSKRQVVILDCCFSGAFAEGLLAKDDGSVNIREQLGGEGRAVLTSSSSTQYSFEQQGSDLSIYTRYLIEGITTGAADKDNDEFISIDELHDYAGNKVREIQPAMKPEIYAIREGFKIQLAKVPLGDPKQKYHKEVARYIKRGEISFVGRQTLDVLKFRLGLSETVATAIEEETLALARQEFREKLLQYERAFTNILQQELAPSEEDLNELRQNLQLILGLRNEDTKPIEAQVKARIEAYKQHLQHYEQVLAEAMRQEYPLSQATRHKLQQMQQEWQFTDKDIVSVESRVIAEIKEYRQKLQQYEEVFSRATQQEYPLSKVNQNELRQQKQILGLKNEDVASIEGRITASVEAYLQKLQHYEQVLIQAIEHEYPLGDEMREELRRYQHVLELGNQEAATIEEKVVRQREINQTQANLNLQNEIYQQLVKASDTQLDELQIEDLKAKSSPSYANPDLFKGTNQQQVKKTEGQPLEQQKLVAVTSIQTTQYRKKWFVGITMSVVILSLGFPITNLFINQIIKGESKISQCNKIIKPVNQAAALGQEFGKNPNSTKGSKALTELAAKIDPLTQEMKALEIKDEKLQGFQGRFLTLYQDINKELKNAATAIDKKNLPAAKNSLTSLQKSGQQESSIVKEINSYCSGK
ncbi:MAG: caspase, EACC1-associated type [Nostoc sp. CreGUA01]|nr:caspase family protein [Nostoc sp. CreGUA01]